MNGLELSLKSNAKQRGRLTEGHICKVHNCSSAIGDHHHMWPNSWTMHLQVQGVVYTKENRKQSKVAEFAKQNKVTVSLRHAGPVLPKMN